MQPALLICLGASAQRQRSSSMMCAHLSMTPLPSKSIWSNISRAFALRPSSTSSLLTGSGLADADRLEMLLWVCRTQQTRAAAGAHVT